MKHKLQHQQSNEESVALSSPCIHCIQVYIQTHTHNESTQNIVSHYNFFRSITVALMSAMYTSSIMFCASGYNVESKNTNNTTSSSTPIYTQQEMLSLEINCDFISQCDPTLSADLIAVSELKVKADDPVMWRSDRTRLKGLIQQFRTPICLRDSQKKD